MGCWWIDRPYLSEDWFRHRGQLPFSLSESLFFFFLLFLLLSLHFQLIGNVSNKLCRWVDTFPVLNGQNNNKITLLAFLICWAPGPTLEHKWGSLGPTLKVTGSESTPVHFSISTRYTTSLLLCLLVHCGWLDCGQPLPVTHSVLWVGRWHRGYFRMYPCVYRKGGGIGRGWICYCHRANSRWQIPVMLVRQDQ